MYFFFWVRQKLLSIFTRSTIFPSLNDKFQLSWHQGKMDSACWHSQAFCYTVFPFILAIWTPVLNPHPLLPPNKRSSKQWSSSVFFTSKLKEEEKDGLKRPSVFSLVAGQISFLLSLIGPHRSLALPISGLCVWATVPNPASVPSLSTAIYSLLYFPDLWLLTGFLYPLSPTSHLAPTWVFSDLTYNRKM